MSGNKQRDSLARICMMRSLAGETNEQIAKDHGIAPATVQKLRQSKPARDKLSKVLFEITQKAQITEERVIEEVGRIAFGDTSFMSNIKGGLSAKLKALELLGEYLKIFKNDQMNSASWHKITVTKKVVLEAIQQDEFMQMKEANIEIPQSQTEESVSYYGPPKPEAVIFDEPLPVECDPLDGVGQDFDEDGNPIDDDQS